nr:hypothetical protein [Corynebacterium lactis]
MIRRGAVVAVIAAFFLVLVTGVAVAEPAGNKNAYQSAYDKCLEESSFTRDGSAARALADALPDAISDNAKKVSCADQAGSEHPGAAVATAAGAAASEFWGDPVGKFVQSLMEGNAEVLQMTMTFWFDFSTTQTGGVDANIQGIKNIVAGLSGCALIASFIIGGYRIAASRRMGLQDGVEETAGVVVKYIIFSFAVVTAVPGALIASDIMANSIMKNFGVTDPNQVVEMTALTESMGGPVIIMILAIVSILGGIMQIIALIIRTLVLPIVVGLTPLAAASSFSETGRSMLNSLVGYMIAAIAYKPVAALLYAVVMWNATSAGSGEDLLTAAVNALMIALAGFCAPALVRTIAPLTAQAGGAGAAPLAAALGAGAAGALGAGAMAAGAGSSMLATSAAKGGASGASTAVGSGAPTSVTSNGSGVGAPRGGGGGGGAAPAKDTTPAGSSGGGGASVSTAASPSGASHGAAAASPAAASSGRSTGPASAPSGGGQTARTQSNRGFGQKMGALAAGTGRTVARGATVTERLGAAGLGGAATAMRAGQSAARGMSSAAQHTSRVLDDSIGVSGFAGGRHQ